MTAEPHVNRVEQPKPGSVERVVSGGQTGVDRGALDAAIDLGVPHGGWCPRRRRAEDGPIDARYQLRETPSSRYDVRTLRNVLDSDGTLVFCQGVPRGGTALTLRLARQHQKPFLIIDLEDPVDDRTVDDWLSRHQIRVLNVAGPRESSSPGIGATVYAHMTRLLRRSSVLGRNS